MMGSYGGYGMAPYGAYANVMMGAYPGAYSFPGYNSFAPAAAAAAAAGQSASNLHQFSPPQDPTPRFHPYAR